MTDVASLEPADPVVLTWTPRDKLEFKGTGTPGIVLCALLFVLSLLLAAGGAVEHVQALRLIGGFGVVIFGLGAAPLALISEIDLLTRLTAASLIGLSVLLGVGALMTDVRALWHPVLAAILFLAAAAGLHLVGLVRASGTGLPWRISAGSAIRAIRLTLVKHPLPLLATVVGTALWLVSALSLHDPNPGVDGFLTKISPAWYVGNVLIVLGFVLGRRHDRLAAPAVLSLVISTTMTPALVYGGPNEPTAAKHVHLVQIILTHHHLDPSAGIYPAYSAFFAGIAWLCRVVGVHNPFGLANYWPVLVGVIGVVVFRLLVGRIVEGTARRWTAVMLVILVNAVGQSYFSPQSISFVLAFGMLALMQTRPAERPLGKAQTTALLVLVSVVLAVTHELTPYVVAAVLVVLAVFKLARFWEAVVMAIPALCWAGAWHSVVLANFSFSQLLQLDNFRPPLTLATPGLHRLPIVAIGSGALTLGLLILIVLAARGFLSNVRRGWAWAYGLSTGTGLALILFQSYGNEGIFRAALFAIPWLAILAVVPMAEAGTSAQHGQLVVGRGRATLGRGLEALRRGSVRLGRWRVVLEGTALTALFVTLLATFCLASFGLDGSDVLRPSEVRASQYFISHAPARSALLGMGAGDSPAAEPQFDAKFEIISWDTVVPLALVSVRHPVQADVEWLEAQYFNAAQGYGVHSASQLYLFWSQGLALYQSEYGLQSAATMRQWLMVLRKSPSLRVVFHQGSTYLFRFR